MKRGGRFSLNARGPSRASFDDITTAESVHTDFFRWSSTDIAEAAVSDIFIEHERAKIASVRRFAEVSDANYQYAVGALEQLRSLLLVPVPAIYIPRDETVYVRNPELLGPMNAFGYSYLEDKLGAEAVSELQLRRHSTEHGNGYAMAYEALNFVDGRRTVSDIRDWLVAEFGTVPVEAVAEYLQALESIGVLRKL